MKRWLAPRRIVASTAMAMGAGFSLMCASDALETGRHKANTAWHYIIDENIAVESSEEALLRSSKPETHILLWGGAALGALGIAGYQTNRQSKIDALADADINLSAAYENDIVFFGKINELIVRQLVQIQEAYPRLPELPGLPELPAEVATADLSGAASYASEPLATVYLHPTHPLHIPGQPSPDASVA